MIVSLPSRVKMAAATLANKDELPPPLPPFASTRTRTRTCAHTCAHTQDFLVFVLISVCDVGSLALCAVLGVASLYYLCVIKMQEGVYFLMPPDDQLTNFK